VVSGQAGTVKTAASKVARYGLYWAQLDPTRGSEIAKTRPVVVVSPDEMNRRLETVVICPLTSQLHPLWASRVACVCDGINSEIAVDLIRTVSKSRLTQPLGRIDAATIQELRQVIALLYVND
jgi:mRNA interferase MazF